MEKLEILKQLKEMRLNQEFYKIDELIKTLESDIKKENYYRKPTDKKKISTIQKILKYSEKKGRPFLANIGIDEKGNHLITDSYHAFLLREENYLPFNYAFTSKKNEEIEKDMIEKGVTICSGVYPNLENLFPSGSTDIIKLECNDIINYNKTTPKDGDKVIYKVYDDKGNVKVTFDSNYLVNAINVLQLEGTIELEFYGDIKPLVIRKNENLGLILPIRVC